jgi:hypothetical protein
VIRLNQRRTSRDQTLTCFTSQTTVGRGSVSHTGRTLTTASRRVVGLKISPAHHLWMSARCRNLDGADARHLIGARGARRDAAVRPLDGCASTQRWARTPARGSRQRLGLVSSPHAGSLVGRRARSLSRCGVEEGAERTSGR